MTPAIRILSVALASLAFSASAEVIRCPSHDEHAPDWGRRAEVPMVAGRALAEDAPRMLETAHFAVFYHTTGVHAVAGAGVDLDGNGHPDNVDSIGAIAERVWRLGIDTLEYLKPIPYDTTLGYKALVPAGKFPIEVADMATFVSSWGGKRYMSYADRPTSDKTGANRQSMVVENDFVDTKTGLPIQVMVDPINTNGVDSLLIDYQKEPVKGWKVGISHEFYHNMQHRYDASYIYGFHELTAVWYSTRCYPDVKHHWMYYPGYLKNIYISAFDTFDKGPQENFPFITAMTAALGEGILKDLWSVRKKTFLEDEDFWLRDAFDTLKIDAVPFSKLYVKSVLELTQGIPGLLNENGALKVRHTPRQLSLVRQIGHGLTGAQPHSAEVVRLNPAQFDDGYNLLFTQAPGYSAAGLLRLPSGQIDLIAAPAKGLVFGEIEGDTAWYVAIMDVPFGKYFSGVEVEVTLDPITTAIRRSGRLRPPPQYRVDLYGRPVRGGARGIILEGSPSTGWTRAVNLGE